MTCGGCINPWIAGVLLSISALIGHEAPAHDQNVADEASQSVVLRLESGNDAEIVSEFRRRLQQYDGVRQRLDTTLPVAAVSDNATTIRSVIEAHKRALRSWSET